MTQDEKDDAYLMRKWVYALAIAFAITTLGDMTRFAGQDREIDELKNRVSSLEDDVQRLVRKRNEVQVKPQE